jgi:hypothetical protein
MSDSEFYPFLAKKGNSERAVKGTHGFWSVTELERRPCRLNPWGRKATVRHQRPSEHITPGAEQCPPQHSGIQCVQLPSNKNKLPARVRLDPRWRPILRHLHLCSQGTADRICRSWPWRRGEGSWEGESKGKEYGHWLFILLTCHLASSSVISSWAKKMKAVYSSGKFQGFYIH